jgi:hypothetical protein
VATVPVGENGWAGGEIPPGSEVIEIHVAELTQLYSIDPSPFHDKDLDDEAEE